MEQDINAKFEKLMWETLDKYEEQLGDFPHKVEIPNVDADIILTFRLIADINNGGFLQFFCNWGYKNYLKTLEMLEKVGAKKHLQVLENMYKCISYLEDDSKIKELFDIYQYISDENEKKLQKLDKEFWDLNENLEELAYLYHFNKKC